MPRSDILDNEEPEFQPDEPDIAPEHKGGAVPHRLVRCDAAARRGADMNGDVAGQSEPAPSPGQPDPADQLGVVREDRVRRDGRRQIPVPADAAEPPPAPSPTS